MSDEPEAPGLYVHVPFCLSRCRYCDFFSTTRLDERGPWLSALGLELGGADQGWTERPFGTLYIGGGTPSTLPAEQLEGLLEALRGRLPFAEGAEVTLEANPDDVTGERLEAWRGLGVTRLSLGVQSFDDEELRWLGRRHDASSARRAAEAARSAGFDDLSLDLIFALPDQPWERLEASLLEALALEPTHLSCYELTLEPRTPLGAMARRGELEPPTEETSAALFVAIHDVLSERGFEHYEVSNYALGPERRSRHNQGYWRHSPYLGLGPSAHSFDGRRRWWNVASLDGYRRALEGGAASGARAGVEHLSAEQLDLEALMLGFRTSRGVSVARLGGRPEGASTIDALVEEGLLEVVGDRARPTVAGMLVADSLPLRFSPLAREQAGPTGRSGL